MKREILAPHKISRCVRKKNCFQEPPINFIDLKQTTFNTIKFIKYRRNVYIYIT